MGFPIPSQTELRIPPVLPILATMVSGILLFYVDKLMDSFAELPSLGLHDGMERSLLLEANTKQSEEPIQEKSQTQDPEAIQPNETQEPTHAPIQANETQPNDTQVQVNLTVDQTNKSHELTQPNETQVQVDLTVDHRVDQGESDAEVLPKLRMDWKNQHYKYILGSFSRQKTNVVRTTKSLATSFNPDACLLYLAFKKSMAGETDFELDIENPKSKYHFLAPILQDFNHHQSADEASSPVDPAQSVCADPQAASTASKTSPSNSAAATTVATAVRVGRIQKKSKTAAVGTTSKTSPKRSTAGATVTTIAPARVQIQRKTAAAITTSETSTKSSTAAETAPNAEMAPGSRSDQENYFFIDRSGASNKHLGMTQEERKADASRVSAMVINRLDNLLLMPGCSIKRKHGAIV